MRAILVCTRRKQRPEMKPVSLAIRWIARMRLHYHIVIIGLEPAKDRGTDAAHWWIQSFKARI